MYLLAVFVVKKNVKDDFDNLLKSSELDLIYGTKFGLSVVGLSQKFLNDIKHILNSNAHIFLNQQAASFEYLRPSKGVVSKAPNGLNQIQYKLPLLQGHSGGGICIKSGEIIGVHSGNVSKKTGNLENTGGLINDQIRNLMNN